MGFSSSPLVLAGKFEALSKEVATSEKGVREAALTMTTVIRKNIKSATGGDSRISGVGSKPGGAKVNAYYKMLPLNKSVGIARAYVAARGPLHFVEFDMPKHPITPKKGHGFGRPSKKRRNAGLATVGGLLSASTLAKNPKGFTKGKKDVSVLAFNNGDFARYAIFAGGSRGRRPFRRGVETVRPKVPGIIGSEVRSSMRKIFI